MSQKLIQSRLPCPSCTSSDAYHVWEDGHGHCFSCEYHYIPEGKAGEEGDISGFTYEFLPWRGIAKETFKIYNCLTKIDTSGKPISLGFRYPNDSYKVRFFEKKGFYSVGDIGKAGLFGRDVFAAGSHKYVTITEGETDALSLYQALRTPVVSVQSAGTAVRDCILDRDWLNSYERIYFAFDADTAGREAVQRCAKLFPYDKVYLVKFTNRKDANAYLMAGEEDELKNIWKNSKKYLPETIQSELAEFDKLLLEPIKWGVPYPFRTLNDMTYGIRTGETVLVTAQEGIGKTELMHHIEYNLLKERDDNVGAIFLEETARRHLQALAGIHLKRPVHLPDDGTTPAELSDAIRDLVKKDDRLHIYTSFGSDDPELFLDTIRFLAAARNCRYILLDHIHMVISGLAEDDERRKLDYFSTKLEMLEKELDIAIIIVSHVNDFGQTRGSRYIGKVADLRIDLTRDLSSGSNIVNLNISKNRFCGKTGYAGSLTFDPRTQTFEEVVHERESNAHSAVPLLSGNRSQNGRSASLDNQEPTYARI